MAQISSIQAGTPPPIGSNLFQMNRLDFIKFCLGLYTLIQNSPNRKEIAGHLEQAEYFVEDIDFRQHQITEIRKSRQDKIFESFIECLQQNYTTQRKIQFYASKLFITPKYLSTAIKEVTGSTAGEWIESFVIEKAKDLLISSNFTIQQISNQLNFSNQSFFGKYFKRCTGISPKTYIQITCKNQIH